MLDGHRWTSRHGWSLISSCLGRDLLTEAVGVVHGDVTGRGRV